MLFMNGSIDDRKSAIGCQNSAIKIAISIIRLKAAAAFQAVPSNDFQFQCQFNWSHRQPTPLEKALILFVITFEIETNKSKKRSERNIKSIYRNKEEEEDFSETQP